MAVLLSNSGEPVHRQVAHQLKLLIARDYGPGEVLPTYRHLAGQLGVGLRSISGAMRLLAEQGVVNPVRRKGTVVLRKIDPGEARLTQVGLVLGRGMHWIFKGGFMGQIMIGISNAISDCHADLRIFPYVPDRGVTGPGEVAGTGVEGVVLLAVSDNEFIARYAEMDIPAIVADHRPEGVPLDCIVCDNAGATKTIVNHLAGLGHRRIAYVENYAEAPAAEGPGGNRTVESDPDERRRALADFAEQAGVALHRPFITFAPDWAADHGRFQAEVSAALTGDERPTAIVTDDEMAAQGLIAMLQRREVLVPRDVSVAAIASALPLAPTPQQPTSCLMDFNSMGVKAIETLSLRARTTPEGAGEVMRIGFEFCPGETTAEPPAR